jgi:subfamily B ATP-binding cassette protein MsbA
MESHDRRAAKVTARVHPGPRLPGAKEGAGAAARGRDPEPKRKITFRTAWRESKELIVRHRRRLLIGMALMLISRLAGLILPASSKWLVDTVITGGRYDLLVPLALAALAASMVQAGTGFALSQLLGVAAQRAVTDMRRTVEAHVLRLPIRQFDSTQTGILISRIMSDAEGIRNLVGTGLVQLVGGMVTAVIALGVLFWLNWQLTAGTLLFLAAFGGGLSFAFVKLRPIFRERSRINAAVTGRLSESLSGIRVVKAYVAERREDLIFARGVHRLFRNIATTITGVSAISNLTTVVVGAIGALMMIMGGRAVAAGTMTLGDLMMYVLFTGMVAAPLIQIASIGTQISEAFAGLDRIREIMSLTTEDEEDRDKAVVPPIRGAVEFRDIWYEYVEDVPVLRGISFRAEQGTTTALVGSSGSGKSTLLSLVTAFNRPKQGQILIDGRDLSGFKLREYRSQLGIVLQDNFLFDGTITENIRFSRPEATLDEVKRVAGIAHCTEFIEQLPQTWDTVVGERGVKLSGGQRQRVAIARAILADPAVLLLDEATSSLDSESEAMIQDGLRALRAGRTTFVIAHRLSTIISADQILVLEAGEIVERGTHRELLALGGRYKQLYDKQFKLEYDRYVNPGEELVATA